MTVIILAGGKSSRIGYDKAFIKVDGVPLINRQVKLLKTIFRKIIIVTNNPGKYKLRGVKIVQDIIADCGPLSGMYSGLLVSSSLYNFVVACDMPFINLKLIKYMWNLKNGFDIIVPRVKKGFEPLFAIYSKNCTKPIYEILQRENFTISKLFDKVKLREISEEDIVNFGDQNILFMNINTQEDYRIIRRMKGAKACLKQYQQK